MRLLLLWQVCPLKTSIVRRICTRVLVFVRVFVCVRDACMCVFVCVNVQPQHNLLTAGMATAGCTSDT